MDPALWRTKKQKELQLRFGLPSVRLTLLLVVAVHHNHIGNLQYE